MPRFIFIGRLAIFWKEDIFIEIVENGQEAEEGVICQEWDGGTRIEENERNLW